MTNPTSKHIIIGVDPSTRCTGLAIIRLSPSGACKLDSCIAVRSLARQSRGRYLKRLEEAIIKITPGRADLVVVESNYVKTKKDLETGRQQIFAAPHAAINQVTGAVRMAADALGAEYRTITPAEWRKGATGNSKADYPFVRACVRSAKIGHLSPDVTNDELAAIAIAWVAARTLQTERKIREAEEKARC